MKRFSAALTLLLFLTGCGRSPDNYGSQPEIPRTETTATTIAEETTATSSTTSTAGYTVETTTSTALTAVLAAKQPKKAAIQETTAVSATEPVSSTSSADIQTEVHSTTITTEVPQTTTLKHTTTTTVPQTSPPTTTVTEPPTEPKIILPNDGSDYGKAKAVYEYVRQNGGGTCVNYACLTYELCEDNGLDCCIVWTQAGLYGHVANIVKVEGIWYVLDTDGEFFLTYNNGFTEAVDIDGNHIADSDVISSKSYDELH